MAEEAPCSQSLVCDLAPQWQDARKGPLGGTLPEEQGNNTDSSAGPSQESTSESSPGDSETTELQGDDFQIDTQPSVPSPSLSQ